MKALVLFCIFIYKDVGYHPDSRRSWKEIEMKGNVLILESYPSLADGLVRLLAEHGLRGEVVNGQHLAIHVLEQEQFDFVLSGALRWENCYLMALGKYGAERLIIYTASPILADQIKRKWPHLKVYRKAIIDEYPDFNFRTPESVIKEIADFLSSQHSD